MCFSLELYRASFDGQLLTRVHLLRILIITCSLKLTVVFDYYKAMETYSRIGLLRSHGNLQSYWTTTTLWKLTVVLDLYVLIGVDISCQSVHRIEAENGLPIYNGLVGGVLLDINLELLPEGKTHAKTHSFRV